MSKIKEYEKLKKNFEDMRSKYLKKLTEEIEIRELLDETLTINQAEQILLREQLLSYQAEQILLRNQLLSYQAEQILIREQLDESQIPFFKSAIEKHRKENDNLKKQLDEKESENLSIQKQLDKISELLDETLTVNLAEKMLLQEQLETSQKKYNDLADKYV
jgi:hypothetical protein